MSYTRCQGNSQPDGVCTAVPICMLVTLPRFLYLSSCSVSVEDAFLSFFFLPLLVFCVALQSSFNNTGEYNGVWQPF